MHSRKWFALAVGSFIAISTGVASAQEIVRQCSATARSRGKKDTCARAGLHLDSGLPTVDWKHIPVGPGPMGNASTPTFAMDPIQVGKAWAQLGATRRTLALA